MAARDVEAGRAHVLIRLRDQVSGALKKVERNFAAFGRSVATAGAAITAVGLAGLAFPTKLSADMEQMEISFEVMLGSAAAAKKMLTDLTDFARKTPFGMEDAAANAELLLGYGVAAERIIPSLHAIGDVARGNAEKFGRLTLAFGQTMAKGRLMGQEVLQMVEAGFNPLTQMAVDQVAANIGISIGEASKRIETGAISAEVMQKEMTRLTKEMERGNISAQMLAGAFASATGPGGKFHGMMEKQATTAYGLMSTLMDAIKFGFKPIGDVVLSVLKPLAKFGTVAADAFAAFMAANQGLTKAIAYTLIGMVAVGGVLTAVGLAAMSIGTLIGGLGTAFGFAAAAFATLFSPIGLGIVSIIALGVAAYHFREQLYAALVSVAEYFQPLTDALGRVWSVFSETFGGIVTALLSGKMTDAAGIAWLGFVAAAWQAIAELGGVMEMALDVIASIIPGVDSMHRYLTEAFGSIGQAILAGRWDLAASIAITKVRLAVESGMNVLRGTWTGFTVILGDIWDTLVFGVRSTWRTAVTEIAKGFIWLAEKFGFAMDGVRGELDRMAASDQAADDKAKASKQAARYAAGAEVLAAGKAREDQLRGQIGDLEHQSAEAFASAGAPTIEDTANKARDELKKAIAFSRGEAAKPGDDKGKLQQQANNASAEMGKISSAGTFSAAAAAQALGVDTSAAQATANNTKKMLQLMQDQKASPLFE